MWNIMNSMGHPAHSIGPLMSQKREFSMNVEKVPLVPGKTFSNPNFVITRQCNNVHSYQNNFISTPFEKIRHSDSSNISDKPLNANSALINSSQSLVNTLKENHLDIVKNPDINSERQKPKTKPPRMCTKRCRRNRKNRRKKSSTKNSKNSKHQIKDMMIDAEIDIDTPFICSDISVSPKVPCNTFNLTDFIINKPCNYAQAADDENECDSDEEFVAIISVSPLNISKTYIRERQVSVSSDDSFVIFDHGTDEEFESSEEEYESETEEEWEAEEEGQDEVDATCIAISKKKVRFAEACEVHTMVQWSFAYQQARKGPWEDYARDRDRFKRRMEVLEKVLKPVFDATHRDTIYRERFKDDDFCTVNL